jgi:hypothetical protein
MAFPCPTVSLSILALEDSSLLIGWASTLVGLPVLGSALWLGINRPVPIVSMRATARGPKRGSVVRADAR